MRPQGPATTNTASADRLVIEGLEAHRVGRLDEAARFYAEALKANPNHPDALNLGGAAAFARGRTSEAISLISKAVKVAPQYLDAYLNLAEALEAAGRMADAVATCKQALAIAPDHAEAYARLAWLTANTPASGLALAYSRVALALEPRSVEALCAKGAAFWRLASASDAEDAYRAALDADPEDVRSLVGLAGVLCETDRAAEAGDLYRRALALRADDPAIISALARAAEVERDLEEAMALHDRAVELSGGSPETLYNRARFIRDLARFDEAEALFRQVLAAHPDHGPSLYALGRMGRLEKTPIRRKQLSRVISDRADQGHNPVLAGFTLADMLASEGDYDGAFARYAEANALYARLRQAGGQTFNRVELRESFDLVISRLAREYAEDAKTWGNPSDLPVFVVGMPRSGTTLVEQICASHSQVFGAGELRRIQTTARVLAKRNEGLDYVRDWDAAFARSHADAIVAEFADLGQGARRVIDKSPLNVMRLGLVGALFPNARVIWCRRDPRDVVVSNHTMYFGQGNLYSTSLDDCAYFVRQIDRIGEFWLRQNNVKILPIVYEDLVADIEGHSREIIDFLGLQWEPACLEYYKTDRLVDTPSSWQVRQPAYSGSIGRWRRYEKHLGPMLETLAADD
ncbi:MAG: sulfotransferase [Caulobacteraceae bacterium]|nr:sulfotransferase [Caulobacteraceae bacterium]